MQHLFKVWPDFSAAVGAAPHVLLLADYDGTLAAIVGRPEDAVLSLGARQKLQSLAGKPAISAGVISGRRLAEVKALVGKTIPDYTTLFMNAVRYLDGADVDGDDPLAQLLGGQR